MTTLTLPAPAKLNLFLHITGRRADGYHELQTVFALLDYGDLLHFQPAAGLSLAVPDGIPAGDDNLVMQAARALAARSIRPVGARIRLDKRLPAGGGVGGGSSDAATTLLGLNALWQLNLDREELAAIGVGLGADVPVFVRGHSAWAEGIGESLTPIDLPPQTFLVVWPGISVSTGQIFGDRELTRDTPKSRLAAFLEPGSELRFRNDCEVIAARRFPAVRESLDWLEKHAGNARMTGTGACVFARIPDRKTGDRLLGQLPARWKGFVACSVNESPAVTALQRQLGSVGV